MKIKDLNEYNKGIQDPNSNAKNPMPAELSSEEEKEIAKGLKMVDPTMNGKMAAKGLGNQLAGKKPTPGQLKSKAGFDTNIAKALTNPTLRAQLKGILKKAVGEGMDESTLAKRILKKLTGKKSLTKFKKRSRLLKEADPKLFEINFNRKEIAKTAFDAPVKCGFEAETFFYSVDSRGGNDDIDNMSIGDIEYEFGDLPDQANEDYNDWLYEKGQEEYLDDLISDKVEEYKEDEEYLNDFIDSGGGPSSEAVERYKNNFEEEDPKEYENREEDGWEYINWVREFVEEEYEEEYLAWLRNQVAEENDLRDEAKELAEGDYSMDEWINDNYSYMSSFLDDYGYEYSRAGGDVEGVADELMTWIKDNSEFQNYPESGDYGETNTSTGWAVENDSSIEADEGAAAELISPVFNSPRDMLTEMKSLFDWSEKNFGTNRSTGLHVTMSWHGEAAGQQSNAEPNKLKMALLLGDEYLLAEFGRLKNSYAKSQYQNVLRHAEGMKRGNTQSFEDFEKELTKGISNDKFQSIHFKTEKDRNAGTNLIEFRIAGGADYNTMYEKVVKACVRYSTIMEAGYTDAYQKDYVNAVFKLLRKSQEIDPKKLKDLEVVNHPVIDSAKNIVGKKDYFDVLRLLGNSVEFMQYHEKLSQPNADKEWKQSIKDYQKNTGDTIEIKEAPSDVDQGEPIQAYTKPDRYPPSKRAQKYLKDAQERFAGAITILARDIADGLNRGNISAKDVRVFREFASSLKLKDDDIQRLTFQSMDDYNFDGPDKEKVKRLKTGIDKLFKRALIGEPKFTAPQNVDKIASDMWQFFQSDDVKDNAKADKLADLLINLNPKNDKPNVIDMIKQLGKERTQNGFVAKLRGSGWGTSTTILDAGSITTPGAAKSLLKFLEPYVGYEHPTSKDHHVNIKSDDAYEEVAQMALVQKMRFRLDHLNDLEKDDENKYKKIKTQLIEIGEEFIKTISHPLAPGSIEGTDIGTWALTFPTRRTETAQDFLARAKEPEEDVLHNFVRAYDDYVIREPLSMLRDYYQAKKPGAEYSTEQKNPIAKKLIKKSFGGFKKFLSAFDKVFTSEGFTDLKAEISNKNQLDKRNKDFEKNVRTKALATINIPAQSFVYMKSNLHNDLGQVDLSADPQQEDLYWFNEIFLPNFRDTSNGRRNQFIYVIPASHWSDANDAKEGLEIIDTFEKAKNYFHTWRKTGYNRILNKFTNTYGITFEDLTAEDEYEGSNSSLFGALKKLNIEVTTIGDSRKGEPGVTDLLSDELTKNPVSGEPISRTAAHSWEQTNDDAEQKRFDAFDWSIYPSQMKNLVAKEMQNDRYGSFQLALSEILHKVVNQEINLDVSNTPDTSLPVNPERSEDPFATARENHTLFNNMMAQGMQNFVQRGQVNDLVYFLNYSGNAKTLKDAVLQAITRNKEAGSEPLDFDSALNLGLVNHGGWQGNNESIFNKFDKLSLQEQLNIIRNSKVLDLIEAKKQKIPKQNNPVAKNSRNMPGAGSHKSPKDYDRKKVKDEIKKELRDSTKVNTTMYNVFEQFEKLPLEKQLELLNSPVAESYFKDLDIENQELKRLGLDKLELQKNKKYNYEKTKKSFYDKHEPKTAEKMLAAMVKLNKFESLIGIDLLLRTKKLTENMPNNNKLNIIKGLLSKHFPVGDLSMQFKAYTAMPIPTMMNAFSQLQSVEGPEACAREILVHFCKHRLPSDDIKKLNLKESYIKEDDEESRLNSIMKAMQDNPTFANRVYKMLKLDKGSEGSLDIEDRLTNQDTGKEKDHRINKNILRKLVTSLEQLNHDFDEINAFVETYGHVDYVNTDLLNKSGVFSIKDMLVGSDKVSKEFIFDLYESLFDFRINISNSNRGPGELGLCLLSPNIELASLGDIRVNGEEIEVKGEVSSGGGRMVNGIDDFKFSGLAQVTAQLTPFYEKHDVPDELRIYNLKGAIRGGGKQGQAHILDQAQQLEQIKPGIGAEFLKLIVSTYQFAIDTEEEAELSSSFMNMDKPTFLMLVGRMSFKNYASKLNAKGFNRLVFLNWIHDKVVNCTTEEFSEYSDHLAFTSLDMADSQNGPAVQVSVKK